MKSMIFSSIVFILLLPILSEAQECDSLFIGDDRSMSLANVSTSNSGAIQFGSEFLHGKLQIVATSPKWLSSIGFETDRRNSLACQAGIILTDGALVIYRSFPGLNNECPSKPQFKKVLPVPGWDVLKGTENRYTFVWRDDGIDLLVNDGLVVSYVAISGDSIPNQPMAITFKTNIDAGLQPVGVVDTVKTTYTCYSYLTTTSVAEQELAPQEFSLSQNYPNPFNPETTIRYQLPNLSNVSLTISNILGQKIRTLVSEEQTSGVHNIRWNGKDDLGSDVASGVYFYRLVAGEFVETRRLLLTR